MKRLIFVLPILFTWLSVQSQTDLSDLMAPPTLAEINAVKADWASRDYTAYNWTVLHTGMLAGFRVDIVSHEVEGDVHYAAVRYPENYNSNSSYPVLVSNHGGASGVNVVSLNAFQATCYRSFFIALPSFRSEELRTGNLAPVDYTSGGVENEMDGDTDDALALLTGVLQIAGADENRVGVLGGSRGGGVSHLMACKDNRIKRASIFYGATDHMTLPGLQAKMEDYVDNGGGLKPPEAATYTYGVAPYLDGTLSLAEARLELLKRSAIYFIDELPLPYQVHHGDADPVVTPNHSQLFAAEFANMGIGSPDFEYYEYSGEGHNLPPETGAPALRESYLCELNNVVLPIELTSFRGTCEEKMQAIAIEWTAQIHQSTSRFELERSTNTKDWAVIKIIESGSRSYQVMNVIHQDSDFSSEQNYYRLKEIDIAGRVAYHQTVEVFCKTNKVSLLPNPSTGLFHIQLFKDTKVTYPNRVHVFDIHGQQVFEQILSGEKQMLDLSTLAKGTYFCRFLVNGNWVMERVILM